MIPLRYDTQSEEIKRLHGIYLSKAYDVISNINTSMTGNNGMGIFDCLKNAFDEAGVDYQELLKELSSGEQADIAQKRDCIEKWAQRREIGSLTEWQKKFFSMTILGNYEVLERTKQKLNPYVSEENREILERFSEKYNDMIQRTEQGKKLSNHIVRALRIRTCPYCNRNYTDMIGDSTTAQMDHFFPKKKYPFFALSLYNLVPCCGSCNQRKAEEELVCSPHDTSLSEGLVRFTYKFNPMGNLNWIDILNDDGEDAIDVYIEKGKQGTADQQDAMLRDIGTLRINELYEASNDYAWEIICKHVLYSDEYVKELFNSFGVMGISEENIRRIIFGNYIDQKSLHKRPLSKLAKDIVEQLDEYSRNDRKMYDL